MSTPSPFPISKDRPSIEIPHIIDKKTNKEVKARLVLQSINQGVQTFQIYCEGEIKRIGFFIIEVRKDMIILSGLANESIFHRMKKYFKSQYSGLGRAVMELIEAEAVARTTTARVKIDKAVPRSLGFYYHLGYRPHDYPDDHTTPLNKDLCRIIESCLSQIKKDSVTIYEDFSKAIKKKYGFEYHLFLSEEMRKRNLELYKGKVPQLKSLIRQTKEWRASQRIKDSSAIEQHEDITQERKHTKEQDLLLQYSSPSLNPGRLSAQDKNKYALSLVRNLQSDKILECSKKGWIDFSKVKDKRGQSPIIYMMIHNIYDEKTLKALLEAGVPPSQQTCNQLQFNAPLNDSDIVEQVFDRKPLADIMRAYARKSSAA